MNWTLAIHPYDFWFMHVADEFLDEKLWSDAWWYAAVWNNFDVVR